MGHLELVFPIKSNPYSVEQPTNYVTLNNPRVFVQLLTWITK